MTKLNTSTKRSKVSNTGFLSMVNRFKVTGHFETSAPNDPEMTPNSTGSTVPYACFTSPAQVTNSSSICFMASRFQVTSNFQTSVPNEP